jgi:spore coat polysaccharide biosynthesis predicted glycosyltransferase SpsG
VTFGGSDPTDQSMKALTAMQNSDLAISLVMGPGNARHRSIAQHAVTWPHIDIHHAPSDMASHMASADMALSAAGSTCWELAFMGVPAVIVVTAENQRVIAERLASEGMVQNLGWHEDVCESAISEACAALRKNSERRHEMSERGRKLIDGRGTERAADILDEAIR